MVPAVTVLSYLWSLMGQKDHPPNKHCQVPTATFLGGISYLNIVHIITWLILTNYRGHGGHPKPESESINHFSRVWLLATPWTTAHSAPGIPRTRIWGLVALPFSRGSSWLRDWTWVSSIAGLCFTIWAARESPKWSNFRWLWPARV